MSGIAQDLLDALKQPEVLQAMANAIAPLLSGKKHAASRDREQSGSAREEHLLEVIRSLKDTIKEPRTALQAANTDQTATSAREVAAEKDIRSSYKAALLKKTPGKSHLVVKDIPYFGRPPATNGTGSQGPQRQAYLHSSAGEETIQGRQQITA